MEAASPGRRRIGRKLSVAVLVLLAAAGGYIFMPRSADLRVFNPAATARAETAMWKHYYEKRYGALFLDLYGLARYQQGFSPWDSFSLALSAARAAKSFQPSRSRAEADAALPQLVEYFRILSRAAPVAVDAEKIAETELDWWQARRQAIKPELYGLTIARVSSLLYGKDDEAIRNSGLMRANAMAYRDARDKQMTDADWDSIAEQLTRSYSLLKASVGTR